MSEAFEIACSHHTVVNIWLL